MSVKTFVNMKKVIGKNGKQSNIADRHNSLEDINLDPFLKTSNYENSVKQLDIYYGIVKRQLLRYQSHITGLYPVMSTDQQVGSIRDSVYCAVAVWSLYQAYRRIDDDRGKSYELGQSAVKCMRGILQCWVKQASRVELFKQNQSNKHALHSKFHLHSGEEIYSDEFYNHLQIDVVSLYILFLVQMITSGLQIIYTQDEVAFVQNLVYYVERAYRTPDFGMWERGSKYNTGTPEIHASSIGMAKSALEAINGCNLFGEKGASWSVVYVDIDAHNRNRSIFETMLPRESSSKGVDACLLLTLSFPAFASHEERLIHQTKQNIFNRLRGKKGFKRFSRDGYLSKVEDKSKRYYQTGEIKDFEGLECEWPLFFILLIIDGVFKNNNEQIEEFQNELKSCLYSDVHGDPVITMYYAPDGEGSYIQAPSQSLFLWGQSLFIISQLLTAGLLHINELDPIRRYLPSYNRSIKAGRYSAFQNTATDLVVQIVLIAESMRLQAMMATYGIQTQTPHEVEPIEIWSSTNLIRVYQNLGVNRKIGLSGRPPRPVGSLGTSKIYRICGVTVLCYPLIFEVSDFYLYRDMALLIDDIKTELQFVGKYWRLSGRPTFCLLIREEHMRDPQFKEMLDLLAILKKGYCHGVKVRIGRLQNLLSSSCTEHLDFINQSIVMHKDNSLDQINQNYVGYQSLTDLPKTQSYDEQNVSKKNFQHKNTQEIIDLLHQTESIYCLCVLWGILLNREGLHFNVNGLTVGQALIQLYHRAGTLRYWRAVRYCTSLLHHIVDSISPLITTVLVNGKEISVGVIGQKETVFDKPMTPAEIKDVMYSTVQPYDVIQAVLQQEVVLYCGRLIATNPYIFRGILKIRVGWVLEAMRVYLQISRKENIDLDNLSPYQVRILLQKVLTVSEWANEERLTTFQRRQLEGCLCRVPPNFYNKVWDILQRTPLGITTQDHSLSATPTLVNMSRGELAFSLMVEETLICIDRAERRQIIVELLCVIATILNRNPELHFKQALDLDEIIMEAFAMYCKDNNMANNIDMSPFYSLTYNESISYLARAVVNKVLQGGAFSTQGDEVNAEQLHDETCKIS